MRMGSSSTLIILVGWSVIGFLIYKVKQSAVENKIYDPFEILGISTARIPIPSCNI